MQRKQGQILPGGDTDDHENQLQRLKPIKKMGLLVDVSCLVSLCKEAWNP